MEDYDNVTLNPEVISLNPSPYNVFISQESCPVEGLVKTFLLSKVECHIDDLVSYCR